MRKLLERLLTFVMVVIFGIAIGVLLLEWLAGCGETYVDAYGVRHQYECLFIPLNN
jgi:hypothetical protein